LRCVKWVGERFSVELMIDVYERLYRSVAKGPHIKTASKANDGP
jgi:hypothetical protein